jgi:hypothetical protein
MSFAKSNQRPSATARAAGDFEGITRAYSSDKDF